MRSLLALAAGLTAVLTASADAAVTTKTMASGLSIPWGVAFLPGGDGLVAERGNGRITRIDAKGGRKGTWRTIPDVDGNSGEGGLLGIAVSPTFKRDKLVYAYYTSTKGDNRIVRFTRKGDIDPIVTGIRRSGIHNGGRIAFGPDGKLYAGTGDAASEGLSQDRDSLNGKILRVNPDGSVPAGNPFEGSPVYSLGHRNVQGLAWDRDGRLWAPEFGQNDTDEVNLIRPGRNYGWPVVEGRGDTQGGRFTNPKVTYSPTASCSPSGAAIVGDKLYLGALAGRSLYRVRLDGTKARKAGRLLQGKYGRIRTVVKAPGGGLWLTTSNGQDRVIRTPAF